MIAAKAGFMIDRYQKSSERSIGLVTRPDHRGQHGTVGDAVLRDFERMARVDLEIFRPAAPLHKAALGW
jgi:hypothetical protein